MAVRDVTAGDEHVRAPADRALVAHPREHELLRAMGEATDPMVSTLLVLGAALAAPLFEELLFRGHLQTLFRRGFASLAGWKFQPPVEQGGQGEPGEPADPPAVTAMLDQGVPGITVSAPPSLAVHPTLLVPAAHLVPVAPPPWATWAAVVATSIVFAAVHPQWTRPPIFLLSLCLGYAYERTGNLWVPIVIHAAFNSVSTLLYLSGAAN
jgi:hypothetical protein